MNIIINKILYRFIFYDKIFLEIIFSKNFEKGVVMSIIKDIEKIRNYEEESKKAIELINFLENNLSTLHEELEKNDFTTLLNEITTILKDFKDLRILDSNSQKIFYEMKNYIGVQEFNNILDCFQYNLARQIDFIRAESKLFNEWKIQDGKCMFLEMLKNHSTQQQDQLPIRSIRNISNIWNWYTPVEKERFLEDFINLSNFNIGIKIWNETPFEIKSNKNYLLVDLLNKKLGNIYELNSDNDIKEWINENIESLKELNINLFDEKILRNISLNNFKQILLTPDIQPYLIAYKENTPFINYIANSLNDNKNMIDLLARVEKYQNIIGKIGFNENSTNEEITSLLETLVNYKSQSERSEISLNRKFEIASPNFELQIKLWEALPEKIRNDNIDILQDFIKSRFGDYLPENLDKSFFKNLNNSIKLAQTRRVNSNTLSNGQVLFFSAETNINMLDQMCSPILSKNVMDIFPFDKMIQILPHPDISEKISNYIDNPQALKLLEYVTNNSSNWRIELNNLLNNMENSRYEYIMDDISYYKIDELPIKQLIQVFSNPKNHFGIETLDDVRNFDSIRKMKCLEILNGNDVNNMSWEYKHLSQDDKKRFALLQLSFGIDIDEANELIKKYGTDTEDINFLNNNSMKTNTALQTLKIILSSDFDIQNFYLKNREKLLNLDTNASYSNFAKLETECLNLYTNLYNDNLGIHDEMIKTINYNGTDIKVHEVTGDFNILARLEQNIDVENEASEFINKTFDNVSLQLNGNCKTYIGQNFINFVKTDESNTCLFGYINCAENSLHYASSTNIKSGNNNVAFSPGSVNSDIGNGIKLRTPSKIIDNSRSGVNETTTQKWNYNSEIGKIEVESPNFVIYVQETNDTDLESDENWNVAQMLASKLKKPILFIPREKCAQREFAKLEEIKQKISGITQREDHETDDVLINKLVVEFNNNREGIITSPKLKDKYFTEEQNKYMINFISERIAYLKDIEPDKYEELLPKVNQILKEEIDKFYATSFDRTDTKLDIDKTREHLKPYEEFLMKHEPINFNLSDNTKKELNFCMKEISQTDFYDMNEVHAIEHIEKVMLFSAILADKEGLSGEDTHLLLVASAFHDSGRSGKDGDNKHAEASAKQIEDYYTNNPQNSFGINMNNLPILQTVIHYHEHLESSNGKTDIGEIQNLSEKYGVDTENFERIVKLCELLKDSDALDRARFGVRGQNKWALNTQYLKSKTSKNINMIKFAEDINLNIAKVTGKEYCNMEGLDELSDSQLAKIQIDTRSKHLPYDRIQQLINDTLKAKQLNASPEYISMDKIKNSINNVSIDTKQMINEFINKEVLEELDKRPTAPNIE